MIHCMTAFIFVKTDYRESDIDTASLLAGIAEAQEVHRIAGEDCYLVKVCVANTEALGRLVEEKIESIRSVCSTRTTVVLRTLKDSVRLPLKNSLIRSANV
jgi:Lrp/AsnC family transcriptional regulator, leucine-responsive regulatory protein